MIGGKRLLRKHIETCARDMSAVQCLHERRLVDHAAARGVDQDDAALHAPKLHCADHVAGHALIAGDADAEALADRLLGEAPDAVRRLFTV